MGYQDLFLAPLPGSIAWGEYSRVCLFGLSLSNFYLLLVVFYLYLWVGNAKYQKKIVVPTTPMDEEPVKIYHTTEAFYLDHLRSLCARVETPTSLVEGKYLDDRACYVRHCI